LVEQKQMQLVDELTKNESESEGDELVEQNEADDAAG
jgi:hypothetical protein